MSRFAIIPAQALLDTRLSPRHLSVLLAIGLDTDKVGWCFLSQETIGEILGLSTSMVNAVITTLESCGYLQIINQYNDLAKAVSMMRVKMDAIVEPQFLRKVTTLMTPAASTEPSIEASTVAS